jgi:AcrR family transcriptional regulator
MAAASPERTRNAGRSRSAILESAERLFSERGYDAASLGDIAAAAGLSRGTPSYFFGSKERLYVDVLDRAFDSRQAATTEAFEPVRDWCASGAGLEALRRALTRAGEGYMSFLVRQRSFVQLIMREEIDGGSRMRARSAPSNAMRDAFGMLRRVARDRGLRPFNVDDAIILFVSLTFTPVAYRNTFMRAVHRDLTDRNSRRRQARLAADQMMRLLAP